MSHRAGQLNLPTGVGKTVLAATTKQRWRLKREGLWRNGISKREAGRLIAGLMRQKTDFLSGCK